MKFSHRLQLIGKPSQEDFQQALSTSKGGEFALLENFTAHRSYVSLSTLIPDGPARFNYEWLINPFQFVRQTIEANRYIAFAQELEHSIVWRNAAPHFCDSSAWTQVVAPMLYEIEASQKDRLVSVLNRDGFLNRCFEVRNINAEIAQREWGIVL